MRLFAVGCSVPVGKSCCSRKCAPQPKSMPGHPMCTVFLPLCGARFTSKGPLHGAPSSVIMDGRQLWLDWPTLQLPILFCDACYRGPETLHHPAHRQWVHRSSLRSGGLCPARAECGHRPRGPCARRISQGDPGIVSLTVWPSPEQAVWHGPRRASSAFGKTIEAGANRRRSTCLCRCRTDGMPHQLSQGACCFGTSRELRPYSRNQERLPPDHRERGGAHSDQRIGAPAEVLAEPEAQPPLT